MGEMALNPQGRSNLVDKSINKYAFDDDGIDVPRWFLDDEKEHHKPHIPVTKEDVLAWKQHLLSIDSRSTRKVVEAKARKKKQVLNQLQKAREKAKSVANNAELGEREKIKQIQKIYKGQLGANSKPNKVYVVSRQFTGKALPKGNVRIKLVDPRMKKDKRGKAAADRRNKVKRKRN